MATKRKALKSPRTNLEVLLVAAVEVDAELLHAEANSKLNAKAFVAQAITNANTSEAVIGKLEKLLKTTQGVDGANAFLRKMERVLSESNFPSPPPAYKFGQMARVYGNDDLAMDLDRLGFDVGMLICLACMRSAERFPHRFGTVDDAEAHQARIEILRGKRQRLLDQVESALTAEDIVVREHDTIIRNTDVVLKGGWVKCLLDFAAARASVKNAA